MSVNASDRDKRTTKQRLSDAAASVFHEKGYQSARVSDIVGKAGLAQGSFYLYFKNKQAIFVELIDGFFARLMAETLGRHPVVELRDGADMRAQIEDIWSTLIEVCRADPRLTRLVLDASSSLPPEERQRLTAHFERSAQALAQYTRHTIAVGIVKPIDADLAGWAILGMVERALHYAVFVAPEKDAAGLARDLTLFELTGLLLTSDGEGEGGW